MNRTGKANTWLGFLAAGIILFGFGLVSGYLIFKYGAGGGSRESAVEEGAEEGLYTCGMHPNVIQKGPGLCPICKMELTPIQPSKPAVKKGERVVKYWVAPMDPTFISDKPGKSPMGMDLVPVYEDEVESERAVVIDPTVVQNIGVRTAQATRGELVKTVRATGEIVPDETTIGIVNLKIAGWIDKVFVDETGQSVHRGDPLLEIYSPQLVTTQEEYLIALKNVRRLEESSSASARESAERTLESTRRRLLYWDIEPEQIKALEERGEVRKTTTLRSPFTGVVTMKSALPGQKVQPGTDLYHISDLSTVWVEASVFDADLPYVKLGQEATMTLSYLPGKAYAGQVSFIAPVLDPKTRDLKIRLEFPNPREELKPGMYADVVIRSVVDERATLIPSEAVIHSGKRSVVFVVRGKGRFIPTDVVTGAYGENGFIQILAGLAPGERVVTSAQFLLDSESSFQEALRKMMESEQKAEPEKAMKEMPLASAGDRRVIDLPADWKYEPSMQAEYEGEPIANAVSIEPDGSITIVCPVLKGERMIGPGDEYSVYDGMRVYYCCPGCQRDFDENPKRYMGELAALLREDSLEMK